MLKGYHNIFNAELAEMMKYRALKVGEVLTALLLHTKEKQRQQNN